VLPRQEIRRRKHGSLGRAGREGQGVRGDRGLARPDVTLEQAQHRWGPATSSHTASIRALLIVRERRDAARRSASASRELAARPRRPPRAVAIETDAATARRDASRPCPPGGRAARRRRCAGAPRRAARSRPGSAPGRAPPRFPSAQSRRIADGRYRGTREGDRAPRTRRGACGPGAPPSGGRPARSADMEEVAFGGLEGRVVSSTVAPASSACPRRAARPPVKPPLHELAPYHWASARPVASASAVTTRMPRRAVRPARIRVTVCAGAHDRVGRDEAERLELVTTADRRSARSQSSRSGRCAGRCAVRPV